MAFLLHVVSRMYVFFHVREWHGLQVILSRVSVGVQKPVLSRQIVIVKKTSDDDYLESYTITCIKTLIPHLQPVKNSQLGRGRCDFMHNTLQRMSL